MRAVPHFLIFFFGWCLFAAPGSQGQAFGVPHHDAGGSNAPSNAIVPSPGPLSASVNASESWLPADATGFSPPVAPGVTCSLPEVLRGAGERIEELVQNVDRFTATEVLSHQAVDHSGKLGRPVNVKFDYLVSITETFNGYFDVDEVRDRGRALERFPAHIATTGTPSLVLIFHPRYIGGFKTTCEGLGEWHGQPAWQVLFEQLPGGENRICSFFVGGRAYDVRLHGRAWILANSYQVARLEADIMQAVPKIRLKVNHEAIEYSPVSFAGNKTSLWLPSKVELFMDFLGHRFYRKHTFTNFLLFSVDTHSQIILPTAALLGQ